MRLRRMTSEEFQRFARFSVEDYAREIAKASGISLEAALLQARGEFDAQLPQGADTLGNSVMVMEQDDESVGFIWYQYGNNRAGVRNVFLCDFYVAEAHRRKGNAATALRLMEQDARENGCAEVGLYVWKHNVAGTALYRKAGYLPSQVDANGMFMKKRL